MQQYDADLRVRRWTEANSKILHTRTFGNRSQIHGDFEPLAEETPWRLA